MSQITEVIQSPLFAKQKKKLKNNQIKKLDEAIKTIMAEPTIGSSKSGDLHGVRVYKYKLGNKLIAMIVSTGLSHCGKFERERCPYFPKYLTFKM